MLDSTLKNKIFEIQSDADFQKVVMEVFRFQYDHVVPYRQFCELLQVSPNSVKTITDIPFLPVQFFKSHKILATGCAVEKIFTSSGTTGQTTSSHYVADLKVYENAFLKIFLDFYGDPQDYAILALLPSYLERGGSSLIYMVDVLIQKSNNAHSGFYLNNFDDLHEKLAELESGKKKSLLIGVSYALLDFIEAHPMHLEHTIVMETGGMKGRRKEMVKEELHHTLKNGFGAQKIHSEYGMTELLSQAYSKGDGVFECPPWMRILTRDSEDAFSYVQGKTGGINVIDLANLYSCSFIATQDLGMVFPDGSFEIKGRFDNSDIRGCNLMVL